MTNPYAKYPKHVHEHEADGTSLSCFACKRAAWEEGHNAALTEAAST